jgi:hypothetical protein
VVFGLAAILSALVNAQAMKRVVFCIAPYHASQHWSVRSCPAPGRWFTVVRALSFSAAAFTCHVCACFAVWGATPVYLNQLLGLNALLPWTNGVIPSPSYGVGTITGGAAIFFYVVAMGLLIRSKMLLRAAAQTDKGNKYSITPLLGSSETNHWCC